jgi:hypothetical protein
MTGASVPYIVAKDDSVTRSLLDFIEACALFRVWASLRFKWVLEGPNAQEHHYQEVIHGTLAPYGIVLMQKLVIGRSKKTKNFSTVNNFLPTVKTLNSSTTPTSEI